MLPDYESSHALKVFPKISDSNFPLSHLKQLLCIQTEAYDLGCKVLILKNSELT